MKNSACLILFLLHFLFSFCQVTNLNCEKDPGDILWYHYVTGLPTRTSNPVLTPEENIIWVIYKWAGVPSADIFCLNPSGDTIWSKNFFTRFDFDPVIIPQLGWIIIGSNAGDQELFCLNSDGTERWHIPLTVELIQSPVIDTLFNIYIAAETKIISFDSAGVFRWEYDSPAGEIATPMSVSQEGVIYFGTQFDKIVAVQSTGNQVFVNDLFGYVRGAPTIDLDGTIFMATSDVDINKSKIEVFKPDGSFVWEMTFDEPNPSAVIIGDSNYIYVRTMNFWGGGFGKLYKIDKTEKLIAWDYYYGPGVTGAWDPTLSSDGTIYLTVGKSYSGNTGRYYAIDHEGNLIWELDPATTIGADLDLRSHMLIGKNGNIYAVAKKDYDTTYLIAIEDPNAVIANSAWPMHKHDQHYSSLASNIVLPQPNITINKMIFDFGYVEPGNSASEELVIYNSGQLPLIVDWFLDSDVFDLEIVRQKKMSFIRSEIIQPGDSILFDVSFSPFQIDMFTDTIIFLSNDPDQPIVKIILMGKSSIEGEIKWRIQLSSNLSGPSLDDFGNIYVAGTSKIWSIKQTGEINWEYEPENRDERSDQVNITISHNNRYLYMPWGKTILSLDTSGNYRWIFDPPTNDWVYPLATNEVGQLFFSESFMDGGGNLYCLDSLGNKLWNYFIGYNLLFSPAIEMNGNIISGGFLGNQGKIFSLNNNGNWNWQQLFLPSSPASIGFENMIYVGGLWGSMGNYLPKVRSYNQFGSLNWEFPIANEYSEVTTSIVTHPDGTLIFGTSDISNENGSLHAIDNEGNYLWEKIYNGEIYSTPAIAENGLICFGCDDGHFYVLNPNGTEKWNIDVESEFYTSPVIDKKGIIYFTTESGFLYAVYGENGGIANSPWPMVQHDPKHTSSANTLSVFVYENFHDGKIKISGLPNPFDDKIIFQWSSNEASEAQILIFNLVGNLVFSRKLSGKSGINYFSWDGVGENGQTVKSGVYVCKLLTSDETTCIKLIKK